MEDEFSLSVTFNSKELHFPVRVLNYGYSYKLEIDIEGTKVLFEREILSRNDDADLSEIYDKKKMLQKLQEIEESVEQLNQDLLLESSPAFKDIYSWNYDEVISENIKSKELEEYKAPVLKEQKTKQSKSTTELVEDLFDNLLLIKKGKA